MYWRDSTQNPSKRTAADPHVIHITIIFRWASSVPWFPTKMNCYLNHNYKHYSPTSNNSSSNIINHPILVPKNLLFKIHNFKHRNKVKRKFHKNTPTNNIRALNLSSPSLTGIAACTRTHGHWDGTYIV